ncbi:hypothetical protein ILYODFUR_024756 [Ilyodon furcidens]|uniref:Uncharacterized protein n=1 Tax=Ilyodon furcidens TaxID=33524 RepID=A0ABV0TB64_9TELE
MDSMIYYTIFREFSQRVAYPEVRLKGKRQTVSGGQGKKKKQFNGLSSQFRWEWICPGEERCESGAVLLRRKATWSDGPEGSRGRAGRSNTIRLEGTEERLPGKSDPGKKSILVVGGSKRISTMELSKQA